MGKRIGMFFFFLLLFTVMVFGDKKARVITETGKKWNVVFLKMSNDTIYLKARKPNGAFFNISGHKSKFKRIEFLDGSVLDFSLSNFPPVESPSKSRDIGDWSGDSLFRSPAYGGISLTDAGFTSPASPSTDSSKAAAVPSHVGSKPKLDTIASAAKTADTFVPPKSWENIEKTSGLKVDTAGEAILFVETKPTKASIEMDDWPVEGASPLTIRHLTMGKHKLRAFLDSSEASMTVTLAPGKVKQVKLHLVNKKTIKPMATGEKRRPVVSFSLYVLSAAALAGSGVSYYLYTEDHKKAQDASASLQQASVKGGSALALIQTNQNEHDKAQQRMTVAQILLGVGAACLGMGIVLKF